MKLRSLIWNKHIMPVPAIYSWLQVSTHQVISIHNPCCHWHITTRWLCRIHFEVIINNVVTLWQIQAGLIIFNKSYVILPLHCILGCRGCDSHWSTAVGHKWIWNTHTYMILFLAFKVQRPWAAHDWDWLEPAVNFRAPHPCQKCLQFNLLPVQS